MCCRARDIRGVVFVVEADVDGDHGRQHATPTPVGGRDIAAAMVITRRTLPVDRRCDIDESAYCVGHVACRLVSA
jgi:hypothetical protein